MDEPLKCIRPYILVNIKVVKSICSWRGATKFTHRSSFDIFPTTVFNWQIMATLSLFYDRDMNILSNASTVFGPRFHPWSQIVARMFLDQLQKKLDYHKISCARVLLIRCQNLWNAKGWCFLHCQMECTLSYVMQQDSVGHHHIVDTLDNFCCCWRDMPAKDVCRVQGSPWHLCCPSFHGGIGGCILPKRLYRPGWLLVLSLFSASSCSMHVSQVS